MQSTHEADGNIISFKALDKLKFRPNDGAAGKGLLHPEGNMNVCTRYCCKQSNIFVFLLFLFLQIHRIMSECWSSDPKLRPTFKTLIHSVEAVRDSKDG